MGSAEQRAVIRAYQTSSTSITTNLINYLTRAWATLPGWRDGDAVPWVAQILPYAEGATAKLAALTDAYLARLIGDQLGIPIAPKALSAPSIRDLRGVPGTEVYTRPFVTTRAAIGEGLDLREAAKRGLERLTDLALTDAQLTSRRTAQRVLASDDRVVGYRRVLKPGKTCRLCVTASTQRYHRAELLPIHPGCQCKVAPIIGDQDPGQVINRPLLDAVHDNVREEHGVGAVNAGARGDPYTDRKTVVVYEHGEYGPTLALAGQHHTGPAEVKARADETPAAAAPPSSPATTPTSNRRLNAGDLTDDQGRAVTAAARRRAAGEIDDREYKRLVREITNTDSRGRRRS